MDNLVEINKNKKKNTDHIIRKTSILMNIASKYAVQNKSFVAMLEVVPGKCILFLFFYLIIITQGVPVH